MRVPVYRSYARQSAHDFAPSGLLSCAYNGKTIATSRSRYWRNPAHETQTVYLVCCVLGIALPYSQFVPWVVARHGVPLGLFIRELFSTRVGGFFGMDVLVSAVVLIFFLRREGKRLGMRLLWLPIVGTLTVGVSLGFPLFLYLREGALESVGLR